MKFYEIKIKKKKEVKIMGKRFWEKLTPSQLEEMSNEQIEHEIAACVFDLEFVQLSEEERNSIEEEMEFWKNVKKEREMKQITFLKQKTFYENF